MGAQEMGVRFVLLVFNSVAQAWRTPLAAVPLGSYLVLSLLSAPLGHPSSSCPCSGHHHPQPHALLSRIHCFSITPVPPALALFFLSPHLVPLLTILET